MQPDVATASSQSQPVRRVVDSDDESTVRPPRSVASTRGRGTPVPPPTRTEWPRIVPVEPRTPVSSQESISTLSSASTSSDAASSASRARMKDKVEWYLEFDKLPATVEMRHGPIPFDILSQQLGFDGEIVSVPTCRTGHLLKGVTIGNGNRKVRSVLGGAGPR